MTVAEVNKDTGITSSQGFDDDEKDLPTERPGEVSVQPGLRGMRKLPGMDGSLWHLGPELLASVV